MGIHAIKAWHVGARLLFPIALQLPLVFAAPRESIETLQGLSIEDLVNVEVTTVSRQPEKLIGAASAIEVVSSEDIRRHGAFNIPEALELSTGLQVARSDVRTWAISARGFNSNTANKMQVMMDGRLLYTPLYSGIFWDAQNTLMHDIDRIEIVRGPGATLWGANAVNGVINIITKEAAETQGWLTSIGAGSHHEAFASARYGGKINDATHFRVYGKYESDDELPTLGGADGQDDRSLLQGGFRIDSYLDPDNHLTFQGDVYEGEHGIADSTDGKLSGANALARWERILNANSEFELSVYYDRTHREIAELFVEDRDSIDVDFQHLWEGEQDNKLLWGLNYHFSESDIGNSDQIAFIPNHRETHSYSAFAQYQTYLIPNQLGAIGGIRVESNTLGGTEALPNGRLFWHPTDKSTVWSSIARATRKPTQIDMDVRIFAPDGSIAIRGNPGFDSELVTAYELGYRSQLRNDLSIDLALFHNEYDDLRSIEPDPENPRWLVADNLQNARSNGAELTVSYQPTGNWTMQAGAVFLDVEFTLDPESASPAALSIEGNDPDHWFNFRTAVDLGADWDLSANLRYIGSLPNPAIPSRTELDLRLAWQVDDTIEIALSGQNLLDPQHSEFGNQTPDATQVPRQFLVSVTWRQ